MTHELNRDTLPLELFTRRAMMQFKGELSVLRQLKNSSMSPWLVICPGTMRGVYGGGKITALDERNLIPGLAGIIGISTGAPTAAYGLSRQARIGTSIYYDECTREEFISFKRFVRGGHGVDIAYLASVFRQGPKRLDQMRIRNAATEIWFGVTEYSSAQERYLNGKTLLDIVDGIQASTAMPALYREPRFIDGIRCNDGGISCRPLRYALAKRPSGIIVFANSTEVYSKSLTKELIGTALLYSENELQRNAFLNRHAVADEDFRMLQESEVPHLIIYTDAEIGSYTRDPVSLKAAASRSEAYMHSLLDRAGV